MLVSHPVTKENYIASVGYICFKLNCRCIPTVVNILPYALSGKDPDSDVSYNAVI